MHFSGKTHFLLGWLKRPSENIIAFEALHPASIPSRATIVPPAIRHPDGVSLVGR